MSTTMRFGDVGYAWRALRGMPLAAAVVVVSLAVGIGVNTVVFSWMQALVLRPLPGVPLASEIHLIEPRLETGARPGASWPEYEDLRERLDALTDVVAFRMVPFTVGGPGRAERAWGLLVSDNYFTALGLAPAVGRFPSPAEFSRGAAADVVVVSHDYWRARLGGRASAIGERLRVNQRELTLVGVTPEGFQGTVLGLQFDMWVAAARAPALLAGSPELDSRTIRGYYVLARLPGAAEVRQAEALVGRTMDELAVQFPETNGGTSAVVLPFWRASRGPQGLLLQGVAVMQGVLLLLLLAICANTATLLLARAARRQAEVGVRLSLGAGPWRIVRLLLTENLLLALVAAGLGVLLAVWGTGAMRAVPVLSTAFPVKFDTGLDGWTLLFAVVLAVLSALACGAAPAWYLSNLDPLRAIRKGGVFAPRGVLRRLLLAVEVALALVVLLVAGLFYRSFSDTRSIDPGFRQDGVLLAAYDLGDRGRDQDGARRFVERLLDGVRTLPGVEQAAVATSVPLDIHGLPQRSFAIEGRARVDGARNRALSNTVTPGYFETLGIGFVEGTDFADLADRTAPAEVVVNKAFAERYMPQGTVIGRRLESGGRPYTIVGVVRTTVSDAFGEPASPALYFSYRDRPSLQGELHLRTKPGHEAALTSGVRRLVESLEPSLPMFNVRTLTDHVETNLFLRRIPARIFVVLGPLLLALATVGMYAVVACAVAERRREIGVRLALGAAPGRVVRAIVLDSVKTIAAGAVAGWLAVLVVYAHLARGAPFSLAVFAGIPAALMAAAVVSCWLPARRAGHIDPVVVLRAE